ncbi:MAG TPA: TIGR01777 family oxidoreductase [Thermoleophilia bacterium]|nr:TIGR01777 family oxidoreductase [Thermoleophilia bacterium]
MQVFERRSLMPATAEEVYDWHLLPGSFARMTPPWSRIRVLERSGAGFDDGARLVFEVKLGPVWRRWVAEHHGNVPGRQFADRQVSGPFRSWDHTHRFVPAEQLGSELIDHIEFELPAGALGDAAGGRQARKTLERMFRFRHARLAADLERHGFWSAKPRLTIAISGAGGLVGSHLADYLATGGHRVIKLVRRPADGPDEVSWDPAAGVLDPAALAGVDAIVNLAGESIAGVWTTSKRQAILASRVQATRTLAAAIAAMDTPPKVFVSASAVGAYGSLGGEAVTEQTALGEGFLADVCRAWEAAAQPAAEKGVRVVNPRFGIVVSAAGGAVASMLPAFKAGAGARLGSGDQYWAWVDLDDLLAAVEWILHDDELSGPVNVTAPEPVTNREFTKTLGRVLRRPAALAAPRVLISTGLRGMGDEMFLASQRAVPAKLRERDFRFGFAELENALRFELGKA